MNDGNRRPASPEDLEAFKSFAEKKSRGEAFEGNFEAFVYQVDDMVVPQPFVFDGEDAIKNLINTRKFKIALPSAAAKSVDWVTQDAWKEHMERLLACCKSWPVPMLWSRTPDESETLLLSLDANVAAKGGQDKAAYVAELAAFMVEERLQSGVLR